MIARSARSHLTGYQSAAEKATKAEAVRRASDEREALVHSIRQEVPRAVSRMEAAGYPETIAVSVFDRMIKHPQYGKVPSYTTKAGWALADYLRDDTKGESPPNRYWVYLLSDGQLIDGGLKGPVPDLAKLSNGILRQG